jgi:hypothetical protein
MSQVIHQWLLQILTTNSWSLNHLTSLITCEAVWTSHWTSPQTTLKWSQMRARLANPFLRPINTSQSSLWEQMKWLLTRTYHALPSVNCLRRVKSLLWYQNSGSWALTHSDKETVWRWWKMSSSIVLSSSMKIEDRWLTSSLAMSKTKLIRR